MATIDAHGYDVTIPQETVCCSPPKEGEILAVWFSLIGRKQGEVYSYRRGGLRLLVLISMGNSYGLKVWSE
jgi:hypothetical protein